ncbi:hypothetical protein E3J95_03305 [Candidatus Aerophobetes bacterium]|uniref:Uncharacterized protein n=1 Tax=Aerophobetes bacterium TaxID=2030807 RepID=A0A523QJQ3_UNCAE|nr:MAG: hypothetical protein E3J95_03305 [Candidatus Aerophobetes bacterium]
MRVSTKGRYGVRAMLDLALSFGKERILLRDIATRQEDPITLNTVALGKPLPSSYPGLGLSLIARN